MIQTFALFVVAAFAEILGCYLAYGGVYVRAALVWLWAIDRVRPTTTDWIGVGVCLPGMGIIMVGPGEG